MRSRRLCRKPSGAVFIKEAREGEYNVTPVDEPIARNGVVSPSGALIFADDGESWVPVLKADFKAANAAYFSVWATELDCSAYRSDRGGMLYEVKAVISDPGYEMN